MPGWRCSRRPASWRIAAPPCIRTTLALRDAHPTGSYTLAALTGRLREAAPRTTADGGGGAVADDHLVADALAYARHWRRLAELATPRPLAAVATLAAPLASPAPRWPTTQRRAPGSPGYRARPSVRGCSSPPRSDAGTAMAGPARCCSGRRRCRGSRRWRGTGEGRSSLAISTASPKRQCAGRASSIGCSPPRPDRRIAGEARSRLPAAAPSPCRSRRSPDACSPVGSMFRRTPVWRAFAIA